MHRHILRIYQTLKSSLCVLVLLVAEKLAKLLQKHIEFQLTTSHSLLFTVHTTHTPLFKELHSLHQLFIKYT